MSLTLHFQMSVLLLCVRVSLSESVATQRASSWKRKLQTRYLDQGGRRSILRSGAALPQAHATHRDGHQHNAGLVPHQGFTAASMYFSVPESKWRAKQSNVVILDYSTTLQCPLSRVPDSLGASLLLNWIGMEFVPRRLKGTHIENNLVWVCVCMCVRQCTFA